MAEDKFSSCSSEKFAEYLGMCMLYGLLAYRISLWYYLGLSNCASFLPGALARAMHFLSATYAKGHFAALRACMPDCDH